MGGWRRFWHEKGRLSVKSDIWCPNCTKRRGARGRGVTVLGHKKLGFLECLGYPACCCCRRPLANGHTEEPSSCKWSSGVVSHLQIIIWNGRPLPNDPCYCRFSLESSPPRNLYLTLNASPLLGSTSSTLHHRPRIMSGQIHVARVYLKVDRENKQRGLFRTRIGTSCFLFKFKECALGLAWHLSHHGIWQNFRLFLR